MEICWKPGFLKSLIVVLNNPLAFSNFQGIGLTVHAGGDTATPTVVTFLSVTFLTVSEKDQEERAELLIYQNAPLPQSFMV